MIDRGRDARRMRVRAQRGVDVAFFFCFPPAPLPVAISPIVLTLRRNAPTRETQAREYSARASQGLDFHRASRKVVALIAMLPGTPIIPSGIYLLDR
jgi:hypothetical protein